MKRFLIFFSFLITMCVSALGQAAGINGLNYQNYAAGGAMPTYTQDANGNITNRTLLSTGTVNTVGLTTSSGAGLPTRSDNFIVRFYGFINIPTAGLYSFGGQADDGIRIKVNNTTVVDSWIESGGAFRSGNVMLPAGVVPVEVMYYENGGGQMVNFQWYVQSTGTWQIVPTTMLATDATYWVVSNPTYSSGITVTQQARKDSATIRQQAVTNNSIHIEQVGDNNTFTITQSSNNNQLKGVGADKAYFSGNSNTVTIRQGNSAGSATGKNLMEVSVTGDSNTINLNQSQSQTGVADLSDSNNHYQMLNLSGSNNTVTTVQKDGNAGSAGHFMETTISGSTNVVNLQQNSSGPKIMFTNVNGSNNTLTANQKDSGQHYLETRLLGNSHNVAVTQEGAGNHKATIDLTNGGGASTINLLQTGNYNQTYSIQQSCAIASGCSTTVTQNQ